MNGAYVWSKIFPTIGRGVCKAEKCHCMDNICSWICKVHVEKHLTRNEVANLMTRIRKDYVEPNNFEWWYFISSSASYTDFCRNIPEYMSQRTQFPSRDKEPLDPLSLPWSNEKMYGKGINSRVRD